MEEQPKKTATVQQFFLENLVVESGQEKVVFTIQSFVDYDHVWPESSLSLDHAYPRSPFQPLKAGLLP